MMDYITLNETPVRTSRNFEINNIKLKNINIPENLSEFNNVTVFKTNSKVSNQIINKPLTYGNGKILEENLKKANHKIKITTSNQQENIRIIYEFDEDNLNLVNIVEIEANGDANICIEYKSNTQKACFHNGKIFVKANKNSNVNITIVNLLNVQNGYTSNQNMQTRDLETQNFESYENEILDNANVNYTIIDIGGVNSISNFYSNVIGENSKCDLKTIYLGANEQLKDINYIVDLKGKKSQVDINVVGALKDRAHKKFKGTINFVKGSKKAKGNENEYCMLLSNKAKSIALPMLLCSEEDVEGNHSCASGKIEDDKLFYIMSRGLSYNEAIKLVVKARFNEIIEKITSEELKQEIIEKIDERLD